MGFGDFFLMTVPGKNGPAHILIDCGVHAANINTIDDCVQDMKRETGNHLALVILTHYHADHMSGFASNYDDFAEFDVGAVWITNRLDPADADASRFMAQISSVAQQLKMQLAARQDADGIQAHRKVENALGVASEDGGGGSNAKALRLLQSGFKNNPPVYYYQGGDTPTLPDELEGMITAELLGPSPKDSGGEFAATDNKTEQYLAALADNGVPDTTRIKPFDTQRWPATACDYPAHTFDEFDTEIVDRRRKPKGNGAKELEKRLALHAAGRACRRRRQIGWHTQQPESRRSIHLQRQKAALCGRRAMGQLGVLVVWEVRFRRRSRHQRSRKGDSGVHRFL